MNLIGMSVPENGAPAPIPALDETYQALREHAQEITTKLSAARSAIRKAQELDIREAADAITAGRTPPKDGKHEQAAHAEVARLQRLEQAATVASNEAAMALSRAVAEHADEWRETLKAEEEKAATNFRAALAALREAGRELAVARGSTAYLDRHDVFHPFNFVAGQLTLPERIGDLNSRPTIVSVVAALAKVVDPTVLEKYTTNAHGRQILARPSAGAK